MDFTNCKRIIAKAYSGANGKKIAIELEGKQYMLKFPPKLHVSPKFHTQLGESIATILDKTDSKIENNNAINSNRGVKS